MKLKDLFEQEFTHNVHATGEYIQLVDDPKIAVTYAKEQAANDHVDEYVVFEVTIPDKARLVHHRGVGEMKQTGEITYRGRIPPSFIKVFKQGKI